MPRADVIVRAISRIRLASRPGSVNTLALSWWSGSWNISLNPALETSVLEDGDLLSDHSRDHCCLRDDERKGEPAHAANARRGAQPPEGEDRAQRAQDVDGMEDGVWQ